MDSLSSLHLKDKREGSDAKSAENSCIERESDRSYDSSCKDKDSTMNQGRKTKKIKYPGPSLLSPFDLIAHDTFCLDTALSENIDNRAVLS